MVPASFVIWRGLIYALPRWTLPRSRVINYMDDKGSLSSAVCKSPARRAESPVCPARRIEHVKTNTRIEGDSSLQHNRCEAMGFTFRSISICHPFPSLEDWFFDLVLFSGGVRVIALCPKEAPGVVQEVLPEGGSVTGPPVYIQTRYCQLSTSECPTRNPRGSWNFA